MFFEIKLQCNKMVFVTKLGFLKKDSLKGMKQMQYSYLVYLVVSNEKTPSIYCKKNKHCIFFVYFVFQQTMIIAII